MIKLIQIITLLCLSILTEASDSLSFQIKKTISLPKDCFTQGFFVYKGYFYLSCGEYGKSRLLELDMNGKIHREKKLSDEFFAEGITMHNNTIIMLTWTSGKAFIFSLEDFNLLKTIEYNGEGWGLTHIEDKLMMSNGSNQLLLKNLDTFKTSSTLNVFDNNNKTLAKLNELEQVGYITFANIWQTTDIVLIANAETTAVLSTISPVALLTFNPPTIYEDTNAVLNGIAYDKKTDCLWLTGKNWGVAYALQVHLPPTIQAQTGVSISCDI